MCKNTRGAIFKTFLALCLFSPAAFAQAPLPGAAAQTPAAVWKKVEAFKETYLNVTDPGGKIVATRTLSQLSVDAHNARAIPDHDGMTYQIPFKIFFYNYDNKCPALSGNFEFNGLLTYSVAQTGEAQIKLNPSKEFDSDEGYRSAVVEVIAGHLKKAIEEDNNRLLNSIIEKAIER